MTTLAKRLQHSNAIGREFFRRRPWWPFAIAVILITTALLAVVPKALALNTDAEYGTVQSSPTKPATNWRKATITWYGEKYHGRKTASGTRYDRNGLTCAVPLKANRKTPVVPYGTKIMLRYKGKTITVTVTDCCPAGTYDISNAGMKALGFDNPKQKLKGEVAW